MARTYEPIASTTLVSDGTISFSSIPATFTDLILTFVGLSDRTADNAEALKLTINADTGSNYSQTRILGSGSAASSDRESSQARIQIGRLNDSNTSNTTPGMCIVQFLSYANTNVFKTVLGASATSQEVYGIARTVGLYRSTSAISSFTIAPLLGTNFKSGATASLFGLKAA